MKMISFYNCKYIYNFSKNHLFVVFCSFFVALWCFSAAAQRVSASYLEYIDTYKDIAVEQQRQYGVPASITLAQGLLESAAGKSYLAREGNNHFGIKCHRNWHGEVLEVGDSARRVCYRQYGSAADSFTDHSLFLQGKRYSSLYDLDVTDYKAWATGLRECGYAEDTAYPQKLIAIIEQYELYNYDTGQPAAASKHKRPKPDKKHESRGIDHDLKSNQSKDKEVLANVTTLHSVKRKWKLHYVVTVAGDSYDGIAAEFNLKTGKLLDFNDIDDARTPPAPGTILYVEKKASKAPEGFDTYTIREGDTPWSIAQSFGIRLSNLLKLNEIKRTSVLHPGDTMQLR